MKSRRGKLFINLADSRSICHICKLAVSQPATQSDVNRRTDRHTNDMWVTRRTDRQTRAEKMGSRDRQRQRYINKYRERQRCIDIHID